MASVPGRSLLGSRSVEGVAPLVGGPLAITSSAAAACATDTVRSILDTALLAEHIATAFYYSGLTSPAVLRTPKLAGGSADPNNPGLPPNGNPHHVRYLQAALDAEAKHAVLLIQTGATFNPFRKFYFPPTTFTRAGTSVSPDSFFGLMERLEATMVGLYLTSVAQFLQLKRPDLAGLATTIMGVEAEHRSLGRIISAIRPPNNLTLENASFSCVGDVGTVLRPFLTGRRFLYASDATRATPLPSSAQIARVVGKYATRRLRRFL